MIFKVMARKHGEKEVPKSAKEIAEDSGLSVQQVAYIGNLRSWSNVTVGDAEKFIRGCGMEDVSKARIWEYIGRNLSQNKTPFPHIKKLPTRQRRRAEAFIGDMLNAFR